LFCFKIDYGWSAEALFCYQRELMKDYYYLLGVDAGCTPDEIKAAYRKLSKKLHPDLNNEDPYFESRFKDLHEAYETLVEPAKRNNYNNLLKTFYSLPLSEVLLQKQQMQLREELLKRKELALNKRELMLQSRFFELQKQIKIKEEKFAFITDRSRSGAFTATTSFYGNLFGVLIVILLLVFIVMMLTDKFEF
jgi:curved DNA-binding protein CbpA